MKRANKLRLRPAKEQEKALFNLCEMSAVLWNKLNYIRRQAFFEGRFDWRGGSMNYTMSLREFWFSYRSANHEKEQ